MHMHATHKEDVIAFKNKGDWHTLFSPWLETHAKLFFSLNRKSELDNPAFGAFPTTQNPVTLNFFSNLIY